MRNPGKIFQTEPKKPVGGTKAPTGVKGGVKTTSTLAMHTTGPAFKPMPETGFNGNITNKDKASKGSTDDSSLGDA